MWRFDLSIHASCPVRTGSAATGNGAVYHAANSTGASLYATTRRSAAICASHASGAAGDASYQDHYQSLCSQAGAACTAKTAAAARGILYPTCESATCGTQARGAIRTANQSTACATKTTDAAEEARGSVLHTSPRSTGYSAQDAAGPACAPSTYRAKTRFPGSL